MDEVRLKALEGKVNEIHSAIVGTTDGKPGLHSRVSALETTQQRHQTYMGWGAVATIGFVLNWIKTQFMGH